MSDRSLPSSFDSDPDFHNEKALSKVVRRLKEEPLIPIGCALTVAAFTSAYRAMRRGDHNQVQRMFRARVAAQAFTVIAMVAGGAYYQADRDKTKEAWKLQAKTEAEEKQAKWIHELEVRDAEDKAIKERLDRRRKKAAERAEVGTGTEGVAAQARAAFKDAKDKAGEAVDEVIDAAGSEVEKVEKEAKGVIGPLGGLFVGSKRAEEPKVDSEIPKK
ncbi:hypoxia induced protein conserved region-domain-containing protein [Podospora appendiculata]|uniref:Hypoxia induced protein conserved region-domain-containing protein n=1 Tax=Podospora appendiculata TaxID=314037 RepID=A0AAE1CDY3_9PEZI|nr:hypoxia induced protein conserved region-domain-containing protein [Podospora appendiculata]